MKRIIYFLSILLIVTSLSACGSEEVYEPEHTIEFISGRKVIMNENEYLGIFCTYTNNSEETCLPCDEVDVRAFQNGIALNIVVFTGQKTEGAIQCDTAVQSGTTADVIWIFETQDDSTVSLEFSDGKKMEIEIAGDSSNDSAQDSIESTEVAITLENCQEYFMVEEKAIWQENAFGEYDDVSIWQTLVLKPEYVEKIDVSKEFSVAFALEAEYILVGFQFDPQAQTYTYLEDAISGEEPQTTDTTVSFTNSNLSTDEEGNDVVLPLRVWSSGVGEREENGKIINDIYKYQNINITRVEGSINLFD
ncbi:MAG: DUF5067 domain-containing protein [Agathobacter sp.]|nr:DUF5067 domain-containing protein [Agathobacter sp.]